MASFSSELSLLIGLGVGVDYALFIVTRYRQGLLRGKSTEEAIVDAVDTSGRAVLFAGITVCIALLGMFALGVSFLYGVAVAASIVVALHGRRRADAAARAARLLRHEGARPQARAARSRRRALPTTDESPRLGPLGRERLGSAGRRCSRSPPRSLMLVLAIPFLSIRLGSSDAGQRPVRHAPPARPTTCSPRASGPASTARSSSSRRCRRRRTAGGLHAGRRRRRASTDGVVSVTRRR